MDGKKNKKQVQSFKGEDVKKLKEELETQKKLYLRALADYHNLEKRINEGKEEESKQATRRIVLRLLPFLDNLEKAEVFVKDAGLGMIKSQFYKILQEEGIEEIDIQGKQFDPEQAEAVDIVEGQEENKVADVLQKGYALSGKVIRPAQVRVTKSKQ
ncbi:nucleotide exchange factor GrpE [Candidatus Roizmanbacteria bacterium RIFCSPLOWO2_12_FULL_40_12]|nr:MAG: nucleotide exchange factor GrpE [Candidatus Roizmanbacteria bacterium RIFCSPHIGHO2_12_41_18]OGK60644.1 MAG: nucleotide exchange factor GrpE [Candidatus Roizmanbacteria bacterium RIFCSPLOWO2_12_FULL_40_12]